MCRQRHFVKIISWRRQAPSLCSVLRNVVCRKFSGRKNYLMDESSHLITRNHLISSFAGDKKVAFRTIHYPAQQPSGASDHSRLIFWEELLWPSPTLLLAQMAPSDVRDCCRSQINDPVLSPVTFVPRSAPQRHNYHTLLHNRTPSQ